MERFSLSLGHLQGKEGSQYDAAADILEVFFHLLKVAFSIFISHPFTAVTFVSSIMIY
jgi:hypothetical protein